MQILNGLKEEVIRESVDEFEQHKIESLIEKGVSFPDPLLIFDGSPYIFPHTINLIQGGPGTNKSFLAEHIAASFLNPNKKQAILNMSTNESYEYIIAYLDTERPIRNQLPACMNRVIRIAGLPVGHLPQNFKFGSLKNYHRQERLEMTSKFIDVSKCHGKHLILFLDVVTDCMRNFNDLTETNILLDKLNVLTEKEEVTIIAVIHENPDGSKKARGHIGTEFVNKASTVVTVGYKKDGSDIIVMKTIKNRLAKPPKEKFLKRSESTGELVFADALDIDELESKKKISLLNLSYFLAEFLNGNEYSTMDLISIIGKEFNVSEKPIREALNRLFDNQLYLYQKGFVLKKRKGEKNSDWYSLGKFGDQLISDQNAISCMVNTPD